MNSLKNLNRKLDTVAVFKNVVKAPVIVNLKLVLDLIFYAEAEDEEVVLAYTNFVSSLYEMNGDLSRCVLDLMANDENFYVTKKARGETVPTYVEECVKSELGIMDELSKVKSEDVTGYISYDGFLPSWGNSIENLKERYLERLENIKYTGYGMFARYTTFILDEDRITPVKYPDRQRLDELYGYEREREQIIKNTEALIEARGANNMLLYGDAGTGKSSSIKAVCNHFADRGVRLVEIRKNQLFEIPAVIDELSSNPLKFVIFIDDLSFTGNDDNFSALKAILEGGVSSLGDNVVIYATSNRRHLVKESFRERQGDEIHRNDTIQETMSLSARFGLTITFQQPSRKEYLNIVKCLARQYGVEMDERELEVKSEAHAIRSGGRSPRTAKQFIELVKSGLK